MAAVMDAVRIGRFEIVSTLGKGAQGTVYLAEDTRLHRRVALKTLRSDAARGETQDRENEEMLGEARIVGQFSHPNIVTLYDADAEDGIPYLVFEFVEGNTLAQHIRERGTLPQTEAAKIALGLLAGIDYAHEAGVVHRDLKPANIMMTRDGTPRVMDFGIASRHSHNEPGQTGEGSVSGTPSYMAPEYLGGAAFTPRCDVFAAGMVLYEMLVGAPALKRENAYQTMYAMARETYPRPSSRGVTVDDKFEAIVMRALEKDPQARYASAADFRDALKAWLEPPAAGEAHAPPAGDAGGGVLDFLLRRMRYKSDFPALSSTISTVNNLVSRENEPTGALADSILKDVSLTNKLLRMVNTAYFQQFGGSISTVSRAIAILGFQKVRNAALSLMLFDHLQNKTQAADLQDHVTSSYFSGVVSRELVAKLGIKNAEEAFICAMFHRLGRLLALFYLHDEACEVARVAKARGVTEDQASLEVLGMSYTDLGLGVAKQWNLPDRIVQTMKTGGAVGNTDEGRLRALSEISNRIADAVAAPNPRARESQLRTIEGDFGKPLGLDADKLDELMKSSAAIFASEVKTLGLPLTGSAFMQSTRSVMPSVGATGDAKGTAPSAPASQAATAGGPADAAASRTPSTGTSTAAPVPAPTSTAAGATRPAQPATSMGESALDATVLNTVTPEMGVSPIGLEPAARANMLTAGIQDITNTLAGEYQLNDLLRIILETMYRAIGFTRVIFCTRDPQSNSLRARFGFGDNVDAILKRGFHVPLDPSKDVFFGAISKCADICIEDRDSERIRAYVPDWYRRMVESRGFVLFPVAINKRPVALIYADHAEAGRLKFADGELNLLKTLRNQAILAIRQKSVG